MERQTKYKKKKTKFYALNKFNKIPKIINLINY